MPFGKYKDFAACVAANQDKQNPEAYCAALHKQITGDWPGSKKQKRAFHGRRKSDSRKKENDS